MSESIFSRYSCRKFSEKPVTDEQLTTITKAGMCAPTARNERPWEFLIIRSEEGRKKIAEASPYAESCLNAQAVIVALADSRRISKDSPWWIQDMSACVENMLIEITELGLGGVWPLSAPGTGESDCRSIWTGIGADSFCRSSSWISGYKGYKKRTV